MAETTFDKIVKLDKLTDIRPSDNKEGDARDFALLEETRQYLNMWHRLHPNAVEQGTFSINLRKCPDAEGYGIIFTSEDEALLDALTADLPTKWDTDACKALGIDEDGDGMM